MPTRFEVLRDEALGCTSCKLAGLGRSQVVFGVGNPEADLVFVGEGPGAEEDKQGLPFVGRSGKLLDKLMEEEIGITRESCYIANVVKCRPPGNRDPEPDEIETCRPWLEQQLELIDPKVVMTLGKFAAQLLLDTKTGISKIRGQAFPFRTGILIPTWHPAFALRGGGQPVAEMRADFIRAKQALSRPHDELRAEATAGAPELAKATVRRAAKATKGPTRAAVRATTTATTEVTSRPPASTTEVPVDDETVGAAESVDAPTTVPDAAPQPGLFD